MSGRGRAIRLAAAAVAIAGMIVWRYAGSSDEREIRGRLSAFASEFNAGATEGLGAVGRAARLGTYLTPDIVIELGKGSPPIHGRETVIGMSARLQPRTAAFLLELDDVGIKLIDASRAEATLTAVIRRRGVQSGDESIDAREFSIELRKVEGEWMIGRIVAVDTLR